MYVDLVLDFLGFVLDFGCLGIMRVDRWGTRGAAVGNFESSFIGGVEVLLKEAVMLVL